MAERPVRSRRILGLALASRSKRKLCFDSDALGNDCVQDLQNSTLITLSQSDHKKLSQDDIVLSFNELNSTQVVNQAERDGVIRHPINSSEPSTSNSQSHLTLYDENTQPKIRILSDIRISGPSEVPKISPHGKGIAKLETNVSLIPQSTFHLDVPKTIRNSTATHVSNNNEEITTANSIQDTDAGVSPYYLEKHTKSLSPVMIFNNDIHNITILPDRHISYETLQNIDVVELLPQAPQDKVQLGNNLILNETATYTGISNKNKSKRKKTTTSYVDFMSDDGDFEWSSTSWEGEDESSSGNEAEQNTRKKRNKVVKDGKVGDLGLKKKKKINKRKERSLNRNKGVGYIKKDGTETTPKTMKENPCKSDKKCPHNCYEISEERRQHIFDYYYSLSSQRKRDWLVANSQAVEIKRKRTKENLSRRQKTYNYFINEGEGRRQICQKFLLNTLDLSQRFVHYTISSSESNLSKTDLRGKHIPANKSSTSIKQGVVDYIKNLPAVPSHYCRKDSSRLYLPQEFKNLNRLYQLYKSDYSSKGKDYVGEKVFKNIFKTEFDITFHIPKKDKCKKCVSFANNPTNDTEEEKKVHLKEAEDSKARFKFHQNITKRDAHTLCVSFDLQKVLNTPYGDSMLFYYTRKYCVYNLTFYESTTREGYCYSWGECDGKRGGNEIATILLKYIQMVDDRQTIKNLLFYSDSCSGQNKNKIVFAAVHTALKACQHIETIQMNFLLPGHTSMPVDSVHAVIENSVKNTVIYAPSQWSTVFTLARKNPKPYNVEKLTYSDFVAWDSISDKYFKNNLAGKVSTLRVITFKKSDLTHVFIKNFNGKRSKN